MSANLKNFGVRLSNVVRPIYNKDTHPTVFGNDALGGLHVVRSLKEFEETQQQRILIGMEVVSLDLTTLRDDNGNIVTSGAGGTPEYGRWRLIDATISCNASKFDCPLLKQFGSNKKCLLEHPKCRISSVTNCKWIRLYDLKQKHEIPDWKELVNIPNVIQWIVGDISLPYLRVDQLIINSPIFGDTYFFDVDGKINKKFLRFDHEGDESNILFWNERILVDHSFYPEGKWTEDIPSEVLNKKNLEIGPLVQQVDIALMYNLESVLFPLDGNLRSFRLNNTKITSFDARNVNLTLEELNLDDNEFLEEIWISNDDVYKQEQIAKYPLKSISVRNCPNLKKIHITDCQVSTVNLRGCIRLNRLFADNCPIINIIAQEDYNDGSTREEYPVYEECIQYFFRCSSCTKEAFDNIYKSLFPAHKEFVICLHTGNGEQARESNVELPTRLGHLVSFDENQPF